MPPSAPCRGTPDLIPRLLDFAATGRLAPVGEVLQRRFLPSPRNPDPRPSLRTVVAAGLRVVAAIGLDETSYLVEVAATDALEQGVGPLVARFLAFIDGRIDGRMHYEASDASAWFVARCDPDFLLAGIEGLLRLDSPSAGGRPWLVEVVETVLRLADDPALDPFLRSFQGLEGRGRPAVISLLAQVMSLVADPGFELSRIETLLDSAVYPSIDGPLEARVRRLVVLLGEATDPAAEVLAPLQGSLRCGMTHPEPRDVLLGTIHDLLLAPSVGLFEGLEVLRDPVVADQLDLFADAVAALRADLEGRDDLRAAAVVLLSTPDVRTLVPVAIDVLQAGVAAEVVDALAHLLIICARRA